MNNLHFSSASLMVLAACAVMPARAQIAPNGTSVTLPIYQASRPFYDPIGLKLDSFLLFPTASQSLGFDDNIFASDQHRATAAVSTTNEALFIASQWSRHSLNARLFATQEIYAQHGSNAGHVWGAESSGRVDITGNAQFQIDAGFVQQPLTRGSSELGEDPKRPIFNTTDLATSYIQRDDRLVNRLEFQLRDIAYVSTSDETRSSTRYIFRDRLAYDLSPTVNLFAEGSYALQNWLRRPEFRDFDLITGLLGVSFEIPTVVQAELGAGILRQNYRDSAFDTLIAPTVHEQLTWNIAPLTSIIAAVDRTIIGTETFCDARVNICRSASGSPLPGNPSLPEKRNTLQTTTADIGVQQEFFHDILGEVGFRYERGHFDFNGLTDRTYSVRANARYLINRFLEADLDYVYRERTANLPADRTFNSGPFHENVVSLTLKAGL